ncbi:hypothetical protein DIPPA_00564 [Diplonema papillatum]|nr:hypothetical protein DIPPA_00564 [Diplonema papillatum]
MGAGCSVCGNAENARRGGEPLPGSVPCSTDAPQYHEYYKLHAARQFDTLILRHEEDDFDLFAAAFNGQVEA